MSKLVFPKRSAIGLVYFYNLPANNKLAARLNPLFRKENAYLKIQSQITNFFNYTYFLTIISYKSFNKRSTSMRSHASSKTSFFSRLILAL